MPVRNPLPLSAYCGRSNSSTGAATRLYNAAAMDGLPDQATLFDGARASVVAGTRSRSTRDCTSFTSSGGSPGITTVAFSGNLSSDSEVAVWTHGLDANIVNRAIDIAIAEVDMAALVFTLDLSLATEADRLDYPLPSTLEGVYRVEIMAKAPVVG